MADAGEGIGRLRRERTVGRGGARMPLAGSSVIGNRESKAFCPRFVQWHKTGACECPACPKEGGGVQDILLVREFDREEHPMLEKLDERATSALLSLDSGDLAYCLKLTKRFEQMGVSPQHASNALCTLVENGNLEDLYQAG